MRLIRIGFVMKPIVEGEALLEFVYIPQAWTIESVLRGAKNPYLVI